MLPGLIPATRLVRSIGVTFFWQILPWSIAAVLAVALVLRVRRERRTEADRARTHHEHEQMIVALARIRQAVESASDAIGIGDMEGTSLYHNRAHVALFGYSVAELNDTHGSGVLFADPVIAQEIHARIRGGSSWVGETDVRAKDGRLVPCLVRADIIRDEQGRAMGIFGIFTDITERRRAQHQLDEQRQRLEVTLQSIGDAVITTDVEGRVVLLNPVAQQMTGLMQKDAAGRPLTEVLPLRDENSREPCESVVLSLLRERKSARSANIYLLGGDAGGDRLVAENAALIRTTEGVITGAVLALRDITRERQRADEAARATKLESLGLMAGSIAHDFGNLLTSMVAQLALAQLEPNLSPKVKGRLDETERVIWRARDVTQQLTLFARGGVSKKKIMALSPLLREVTGFAVGGVPVQLECDIAKDLWDVEADEGQLVQVVNNLAVNAVQAMPHGGTLRVTARNDRPGTDSQAPARDGHWVRIAVADTGTGIPPEHWPKIFEPFFTTKPRGTGLGLATSYSIVKKHGGQISVESVANVGTTFTILLPAALQTGLDGTPAELGREPVREAAPAVVSRVSTAPFPTATPARSTSSNSAPGFKVRLGRILVMDDEPLVREMLTLMLTLLNYEAVECPDGESAIRLFLEAREQKKPFDLVMLDLRVPRGLGGLDTMRQMRKIDPLVKAVVASGDREDPAMSDCRAAGFAAAVAKPFKMSTVDSVLRELLSPAT